MNNNTSMSATYSDFLATMEQESSENCLGNFFENLSDSHSESEWSDISSLDNINNMDLISFDDSQGVASIYEDDYFLPQDLGQTSSQTSHFDTNNFPTSVNDIIDLNEVESKSLELDYDLYMSDESGIDVSYSLDLPVIKVEGDFDNNNNNVEDGKTADDDMEEEDSTSDDEHLLQVPKRRHQRKYSSTDDTESDEDWAPEAPKYFRKKSSSKRISSVRSRIPSHRPVPQRRSPGTKLKITQWIVELLRNPNYNPKVITWVDERSGVFTIKDTAMYAKLWGKVKQNDKMTYEKLSRAMRYSYKNDELRMVPEQRLTYKFGANMVNFRAENPEDPNFQQFHKNKA